MMKNMPTQTYSYCVVSDAGMCLQNADFAAFRTVFLSAVFACVLFSHAAFSAEPNRADCKALNEQIIDGITVQGADWLVIEAPSPRERSSHELCVVRGHRPPFLDIELALPANWAGRYLQQGGAGLDGRIFSAVQRDAAGEVIGLHPAVARHGAAYASSNGGNRLDRPGEGAPQVWLSGNADAQASLLDFSYLALEKTIGFARATMRQFYGRVADFSYFSGSSNGGRHAYIVAQRWPQYFDGIVAGKETMNLEGTSIAWLKMGQIAATPAALSADQYRYAYQEALAHCDTLDGKKDGMLLNPYLCDFAAETLACNSKPAEFCLSTAQLGTLDVLLSDHLDRNGKIISSAFPWTDFGEFAPAFTQFAGVSGLLATGDPSWLTPEKLATFDAEHDQHMIIAGLRYSGAAHDVIGVAQYLAAGNKLISWHGGSDNLHPAKDHARMFQKMMGIASKLSEGSDIDTSQSAGFFIVPGAMHADAHFPEVDWVSAIINWVEKNREPADLTFRKGEVEHPVCRFKPYPDFSKPWPECRARQ